MFTRDIYHVYEINAYYYYYYYYYYKFTNAASRGSFDTKVKLHQTTSCTHYACQK